MTGVWLFIASEAVLFFGLLWSCVHLGMSPNVTVQMQVGAGKCESDAEKCEPDGLCQTLNPKP